MQRHHTGSGRRQVLPVDWSAHHRPILDTTRSATVTLRRPGGTPGTFNRATGEYDGGSLNTPYFGDGATEPNARIQVTPANERDQVAGEQKITTLPYSVMLDDPVTGMQLDDLLTVAAMDDNGDAWLVGKVLHISSIESGSLHWERRLICTLDLETQS